MESVEAVTQAKTFQCSKCKKFFIEQQSQPECLVGGHWTPHSSSDRPASAFDFCCHEYQTEMPTGDERRMEAVTQTTELIDKAFSLGMIQVREEITDLVEFLRQRPLRNVMEIGSESGGTFYLWARLAKMGGLKISLDKPDGTSGSWLYKEPDALAKRTALFQSFAPRVKVVTGDSHSPEIKSIVMDILGDQKLDFLFIDGDHSYEGVKADWDMYREFVRPGGIVAFHDINQGEYMNVRGCQVGRLWTELVAEWNVSMTHWRMQEFNKKLHWAGIGVIVL